MIQYIDVHSHIFPEIKKSKTKVRVPYNIREQEILDDNNEVKVEYIYDEEVEGKKFEELPEDWVCPLCGAPKNLFKKM